MTDVARIKDIIKGVNELLAAGANRRSVERVDLLDNLLVAVTEFVEKDMPVMAKALTDVKQEVAVVKEQIKADLEAYTEQIEANLSAALDEIKDMLLQRNVCVHMEGNLLIIRDYIETALPKLKDEGGIEPGPDMAAMEALAPSRFVGE